MPRSPATETHTSSRNGLATSPTTTTQYYYSYYYHHDYAIDTSSVATTELNALIDAHLAWQDNDDDARRPTSRGTLLVDWDGSGDPVISYRKIWVFDTSYHQEEQEEEEEEEGEGEGEECIIPTLVPSPLRTQVCASMPTSPLRCYSMAMAMADPVGCRGASAPLSSSPVAMDTIGRGRSFQDRVRRGGDVQKALPLLPEQRDLPSIQAVSSEWEYAAGSAHACESSGPSPLWYGADWPREVQASVECVAGEEDERDGVHERYYVDVEKWVERTEKKRQRQRGKERKKRKGVRGTGKKTVKKDRWVEKGRTKLEVLREEGSELFGVLDKEWRGAKRVLKKIF